jgi:hypothetical protein
MAASLLCWHRAASFRARAFRFAAKVCRYRLLLLCSRAFCAVLGSLKAHDWQVIAEHVGEFLLVDVLPDEQLAVMVELFAVLRAILKRSQTENDLIELKSRIVRFLILFESKVPSTELAIVFHLLLHVPDDLRYWGPCKSTWMYGVERYALRRATCWSPACRCRFNAVIGRMIHNLSAPEVNMISVFRMYTHAQYLPVEYQQSLAAMLARTELGREFATRHLASPTLDFSSALPVLLQETSRRGQVTLSDSEYAHVRRLARTALPDYDGVCSRFEKDGLAAGRRALVSSADLAKWAMINSLSAADVALASGPPETAIRYFGASVKGERFGSVDRESKRAVCRSRNSGFAISGARLGKRALFGHAVDFLDFAFAAQSLVIARVRLYESMGQERRTRMHRVSMAQPLAGPSCEFVLASDFLHSVAFAEHVKETKVFWVIDCSRG